MGSFDWTCLLEFAARAEDPPKFSDASLLYAKEESWRTLLAILSLPGGGEKLNGESMQI